MVCLILRKNLTLPVKGEKRDGQTAKCDQTILKCPATYLGVFTLFGVCGGRDSPPPETLRCSSECGLCRKTWLLCPL